MSDSDAKPDLEKLWALAEASTPGPWRSAGGYVTVRDPDRSGFTMSIYHLDEMGHNGPGARFQAVPYARAEDAAFVAASRTAVPWLLDRVAELERELAEAKRMAIVRCSNCADERRKRVEAVAALSESEAVTNDAAHHCARRETRWRTYGRA